MKKLFSVILLLTLVLGLTLSVSAGSNHLHDEADLLTDSQEAELEQKLAQVSQTYSAQLVIVTIPSVEGDVDAYVEHLYDDMAFGYGPERDGVLLLVCMAPREYRILSNGFAGSAIDTYDIEAIGGRIVSDLSAGNYHGAFDRFIDQCGPYLDGYINGYPFNLGRSLLIGLVIGLVVGLIVALVLKAQLKTVRRQNRANVYVQPGSMQITRRNDFFLYRNVTRTRRESSSSSSSRSSGSSRSVGGGSF